jgi:hypothetical protein
MAHQQQPDLFLADIQPGLLENQPAQAYRPDPETVRRCLYTILAEARAAQTLPWEQTKVSLYRTIFPQMSLWLPEDEAAQLRLQFETELERLQAA